MASSEKNLYYIVTRKPAYLRFNVGRICYISESKYMSELHTFETMEELVLPVICMGSSFSSTMKLDDLRPVSALEAELLQALGADSERLRWFNERGALQTAQDLTQDTPVTVEVEGMWLRGVIRYIGRTTEPKIYEDPITGIFFGIELQGEDKGKGTADGTYNSRAFFSCKRDCGIFVPFSRVRPIVSNPLPSPAAQPASLQPHTEPLSAGERVTFFMLDEENARHGMVMGLEEKEGQMLVHISTDRDERGVTGGEMTIPLDYVMKEELLSSVLTSEPDYMVIEKAPVEDVHPLGLNVNSLVEVNMAAGRTAYGIIRWVGTLSNMKATMAGLELEEGSGVSDGTFKGQRFFSCPAKRGLFVKLLSCRLVSRFRGAAASHSRRGPTNGVTETEDIAPITSVQVEQVLIGRMKGIQGHCNSCYMDSALFSLFSCSSVLDSLLFKSTEPQDSPIQDTLLHDIVNPLRRTGFVEGRHIMKLRQQLQERGHCPTFTTEEKDPEEFLSLIMHHILCLEPLLKLSAGGKVHDSYCYQIFPDQNHSLVLPTIQQLLEHSFHSEGLKLAEVPSCLILQMPRFGKKFKMFQKIVPSLELDITDLLSEGPKQCVLCGQLASEECVDCFRDPVLSRTGFKLFCKTCSGQVHSHPQRQSHGPSTLRLPEGYPGLATPRALPRETMELFAVLCIETSHYVSFIKHGPSNTDWIFFDSMADRQGERDGFNIPQVLACPEVGHYLDMSPMELANQVPRDMKGVAKRLFCDAYMYLYQSPIMSLYR